MIPYAGFDPEEIPLHPPRGRNAATATHCARGHAFTPENTTFVRIRKWTCRRCKECQRANDRARYQQDERVREAKKARAKAYWHQVHKKKDQQHAMSNHND